MRSASPVSVRRGVSPRTAARRAPAIGRLRDGIDPDAVSDRVALAALPPEGSLSRAVLHGDAGARYGRLVAVMDVLRGAGVTDLNLVTARPQATP